MSRLVRIDELDSISAAGINWRPVRRTLGITGFGVNAYTADAGEQLIEEHDETGGHEELYVVVAGAARFTVDEEPIDVSRGALLLVEPQERRLAVALGDGTTALVIGGAPGTHTPSAWEYYFAAQPAAAAGDPVGAYSLAAEGLADHGEHGSLHYQLACYAALAGERERALDHLHRACALNPEARKWAATDSDLDTLRADPGFPN